MKSLIYYFLFLTIIPFFSCNSEVRNLFGGPKTPHEKYEDKLEDIGLDESPAGREWLAVAEKALLNPPSVQLPYRIQGHFPKDKPRALALAFPVKQGEQLVIELTRKTDPAFILYTDLFQKEGAENDPVYSAEADETRFTIDVEETGTYLLRLQPQLNNSGEYELSVSTGPSLGFPVSGTKTRTGSFWGDSRDGGKRSHEGIDIFAPKLTPAIASADGYITAVREGGLGGKTVWLRPEGKNYTLYYAHLDKQMVREGQSVKKGDVVGLVGNTGNAKHTPAHLHFGIYTNSGAVDPFPFVDKNKKAAVVVTTKDLDVTLQLLKGQKNSNGETIAANTLLQPLAVTAKGFLAELPGGEIILTPFSSVKAIKKS